MSDPLEVLSVVGFVFTVVGFLGTWLALGFTWRHARNAAKAATEVKQAIQDTGSKLASAELVSMFAAVREEVGHVSSAAETDSSEVAQFALRRLAERLRRAAALAQAKLSPDVELELVGRLEVASQEASRVKGEIAKRPKAKVKTTVGAFLLEAEEIALQLAAFETVNKYELKEAGSR